MFALVENGVVVKHPYSATDLKRAHKEISFPKNPSDAQLADWNVLRVFNSTPPTFNALTEVLEETTPIFTDNRWTQVWSVRAATAEEVAQRQQQLQDQIITATQQRLDDFASERGYDGILSACTYASSAVPKFQTEGQYCANSRDDTWSTLYVILAEVQAGTRAVPTGFDDIEADLPTLSWPAES